MSSGNGSSAEDVDATLQRGPEGGSRRIRLLSYNTFLRPPPVGSSTDYKDARSKKMVEETIADFDIVCLQELFGSYTSRREKFIANAKRLHKFEYHSKCPIPSLICSCFTAGGFKVIDGGLVTLSKHNIVEEKFVAFTRGCESDKLAKKGVLYSKVLVGQESGTPAFLNVFSTHTQASYTFTADDASSQVKKSQVDELCSFVSSVFDEKKLSGPVIITGDFNINTLVNEGHDGVVQSEYQHLTSSLEKTFGELKAGAVTDVFFEAYGGEHVSTTCPYEWQKNGQTEVRSAMFLESEDVPGDTEATFWASQRLDYCFLVNPSNESKSSCTSSAVVRSCKVEPFLTPAEPYRQLSDHNALVFEFDLST